jgi:hypothetical protein
MNFRRGETERQRNSILIIYNFVAMLEPLPTLSAWKWITMAGKAVLCLTMKRLRNIYTLYVKMVIVIDI